MNMINQDGTNYNKELYKSLRVDCEKCFGFCCVALYFSASEGFPANKDAGKPCLNLQPDFSCAIHKNLRKKGLKGCTAYDCFGAGQKVAQVTYGGSNWQKKPETAKQMFEVFLIMRQLHEMLWYLTESFTLQIAGSIKEELSNMISETEHITKLNADSIIALDLEAHRDNVNALLLKISELVRTKACNGQKTILKNKKKIAGRLNCIGADLRKVNLRGADLRGAFLIAANLSGTNLSGADLIGVDLRDANIKGANLTESIFITQSQINTAQGDSNTKLPISLTCPTYWEK